MGSRTYLLFGIDGEDMEEARVRIEHALGISMELHESDYRGGDYYRLGREGEHFILQKNFDDIDGAWTEPCCKECGLLFYVNETNRVEFFCAALSGCAKLVWRKEV